MYRLYVCVYISKTCVYPWQRAATTTYAIQYFVVYANNKYTPIIYIYIYTDRAAGQY